MITEEVLERMVVELRGVREQMRRERRRNIAVAAVAVGTAVAMVVAVVAGAAVVLDQRGEQRRVLKAVSVDCPGIRDIATFDLPPTAAKITRELVRNYYASYQGRCVDIYGPLPPIDPEATKPAPSPTPTRSPTPTPDPTTARPPALDGSLPPGR